MQTKSEKPERILALAVREMLLDRAKMLNCKSDEIAWFGIDPADKTKHILIVEEDELNCYGPEDFGLEEKEIEEIPVNSFITLDP